MNVKFCLAFPREVVSVPVMRRVLGDTLRNLGIADECVGDILVAVTEACTNVLRHGGTARRYEVVASIGRSRCLVEVVDCGQGFSTRAAAAAAIACQPPRAEVPVRKRSTAHGNGGAPRHRSMLATATPPSDRTPPRPDDRVIARLPESGRGLQIMRAMVDDVTLQSGPGLGTVVSMRKRVSWRRDAPFLWLSDRKLRDAG